MIDRQKAAQAREDCRRYFRNFAKAAIREKGPLPIRLEWGWYLDLICDSLQGLSRSDTDLRTLVIAVPPRHLKSTLVSVLYPAWVWLRDPGHRFICASYDGRLSERDARHSREVIVSKWYTRLKQTSGIQWDLKTDSRAISLYETTKHGARFSTSTKAAVTGHGAHTIIIDDPLLVKPTYSEEELQGVSNWYTGTMRTRFDEPSKGKTIVIMQRVHEEDLVGTILARSKEDKSVKSIVLPLVYDKSDPSPLDKREFNGDLLSPSHFTRETVTKIKQSMTARDFDRQFQQQPSSAQGNVFDVRDFLLWYSDDDIDKIMISHQLSRNGVIDLLEQNHPEHKKLYLDRDDLYVGSETICSWDCSFEADPTSDFVAGQAWRVINGYDCLFDTVCERLGFSDTVSRIISFAEKHKTNKLLIERKANGHGIIDVLKRLDKFEIHATEPKESKVARALRWTQRLKNANGQQSVAIRHPLVCDWTNRYLQCMRSFPKGAHDDEVDATTQTLGFLGDNSVNWEQVLQQMNARRL